MEFTVIGIGCFLVILLWLFTVRSGAPDPNDVEEAPEAILENMLGMFGVAVVVMVVFILVM